MTFEIVRVGPDDAGLFDRTAPEVFDHAIEAHLLGDYLADPAHVMVLAMSGDLIVGQAAAVLHRHPDKPTELYIDEVGVSPAFQQQGLAARMMEELQEWGRELGCEDAWLGTERNNEPAKALYAKYTRAEPILMYYWSL